MKVSDHVSSILKQKNPDVSSIEPGATVYQALEVMAKKEIGALLVMQSGRLLGLLSERDYARNIILKGRSSKETKVSDIMMTPAITISPNCMVDEAMRLMTESRVRHLPVVRPDGSVQGIVSIGDLVKWIITSHEHTIEQLHSYIAGQS